jgi:hypothetical protein
MYVIGGLAPTAVHNVSRPLEQHLRGREVCERL